MFFLLSRERVRGVPSLRKEEGMSSLFPGERGLEKRRSVNGLRRLEKTEDHERRAFSLTPSPLVGEGWGEGCGFDD